MLHIELFIRNSDKTYENVLKAVIYDKLITNCRLLLCSFVIYLLYFMCYIHDFIRSDQEWIYPRSLYLHSYWNHGHFWINYQIIIFIRTSSLCKILMFFIYFIFYVFIYFIYSMQCVS